MDTMTRGNEALLVIDMQRDFCDEGSPLCVAGAMDCLPQVEDAVRHARSRNIPVVWIVREHHATGCDVERFRRGLYSGGRGPCTRGTPGAELVHPLEISPGDHKIIKTRFSGFHHTNLAHLLREGLGVDRVVLAGVQSPNCIRATAMDAVALDFPSVVVLSDATASATPEVQAANMHDLRNMGCTVIDVAEWAVQGRTHHDA